jgi:CheY-like chemotaxis protein
MADLKNSHALRLMTTKLRILLIEDNIADAELIVRELEDGGFSFSLARIQTEPEFRHELEVCPPDLILSDHGLPSFSGFKALEIVRAERPQLPFIFVSGSNDQGMVVDMYEQGATDYVFKRDLGDLKSAVRSALEPHPKTVPAAEPGPIPNPAQAELKLHLPMLPPAPPVFMPAIGHLLFCPQCRRARDEAGRVVLMEDYCGGNRTEIVVLRQACVECSRLNWWS